MTSYYQNQFKLETGEERLFLRNKETPRFSIYGLGIRSEEKLKNMLRLEVGESLSSKYHPTYKRVK